MQKSLPETTFALTPRAGLSSPTGRASPAGFSSTTSSTCRRSAHTGRSTTRPRSGATSLPATADPTGRPARAAQLPRSMRHVASGSVAVQAHERSPAPLQWRAAVRAAEMARRGAREIRACRRAEPSRGPRSRGGVWVLHPLLVSRHTLYIVQREAMLPATFVLLGLLGYLAGRRRGSKGTIAGVWIAGAVDRHLHAPRRALARRTARCCRCSRGSSKRSCSHRPAHIRRRRALSHDDPPRTRAAEFAVFAWLVVRGAKGFIVGTAEAHRPWTLGERLLHRDAHRRRLSRAAVDPASVFAWAFQRRLRDFDRSPRRRRRPCSVPSMLVALVAFAFAVRRRLAALAAAILFFFAGPPDGIERDTRSSSTSNIATTCRRLLMFGRLRAGFARRNEPSA